MSSNRSTRGKPYSRPPPRGNVDGQWVHDKAPTGPAKMRAAPPRGPAAAAIATAPAAALNTKLRVQNLHYDVTPKDLMSIFGQIGTLVREPLLLYDRSGRSEGQAIISFENAVEATRAKKQFQGLLAKGQPMTILFEPMPPRAPRRATSAPTTASLLNRIEKPPLKERISQDDSAVKPPAGPRALTGPVRSRPSLNANTGGRRARRGTKKPKTAEDLDKELDAFMGDAETTPDATAPPVQEMDTV